MRILAKTALILLGLAAVLIGVSFNVLRAQDLGPRTQVNRNVTTETRPVTAEVTAVKLDGDIDLVLKQGSTPSLVVKVEQRLLSNVVTVQDGKTLRITTKGLIINSRRPMIVELTLPSLEQLQVTGSGDSVVSGFSGEAIDLALQGSGDLDFDGKYRKVSGALQGSGDLHLNGGEMESVEILLRGSGDVTASGKAANLNVRILGSGDLRAHDLLSDKVSLDLKGSGDAHVFARNAATIDIMGSGDVIVAGKPATRQVNAQGSGEAHFE